MPSHQYINSKSEYYLGVDPSRKGNDETAFVIIEQPAFASEEDPIYVVYIETTQKTELTDTIGRVLHLNSIFDFKKIVIDETGLGSGVVDVLKEKIQGGIIEGVTFSRKSKAELFYSLKLLMQQSKIKFPNYLTNNNLNCKKLFYQFLSISQEFSSNSELPKIFHEDNAHDDIVCSLALAVWPFRPAKMHRRSLCIAGTTKRY